MISFQPLTLQDIPQLRPYFSYATNRLCDHTVGGTFMWRDYFQMAYALVEGHLIFRNVYPTGQVAYTMPLGPDPETALEAFLAQADGPLAFCTVSEGETGLLTKRLCFTTRPEPDWSDYLYLAQDIAQLKGKKYHGQRNHVNFFKNNMTDWALLPLTPERLEDARAFYRSSPLMDAKDSPIFFEEQAKTLEVLEHYELYGFQGCILYVEGHAVGFAMGETVGDTLFCHIEKADPTLRGAYPMLASGFAQMYATHGVEYLNREEDVGDLGLRASKQAYHPCEILKKMTVICNGH